MRPKLDEETEETILESQIYSKSNIIASNFDKYCQ